ncbi:hypothetical protein CHS0354_008109 [Potamilus streckersoni]|uniref:Protein kinase domain-containing protein n=1 Tax=Potamilus streckersoni TaxID=2493646 RepID=A0AAE0SZL8_9BIVA|nr:hypothetical protein CHS0354_008109 [Potamilus streckersoni]
MGAESSVLENVEWTEPIEGDHNWGVRSGIFYQDENEKHVSLFTTKKNDKTESDLLRHLIKNLKLMRHPFILQYVASQEHFEGPQLVTEQVFPLMNVLAELSSLEVCAGLQSILDALSFLHDKAEMCHNNVCIDSIWVTKDGSWRLGGLEHAVKFSDATIEFLEERRALRYEKAIAPEEKQGKFEASEAYGSARDVYAFGFLCEEIWEKLQDLGDVLKTFERRIADECLNTDPRKRPKAHSLLNDRIFNQDFMEIFLFLKNVAVKSDEERKHFFRHVLQKLLKIPEQQIGRRLISLLLGRFVLLDSTAVEYLLPHVLTPRRDDKSQTSDGNLTPLLNTDNYKKYVVPHLLKIFSVHDIHIRAVLLKFFHAYVELLDKEDLKCIIFPQVLLGLGDSSNLIVEKSLRALADMVPVLGRDVIIGGKSKTYFKDGRPKVIHDSLNGVINKLSNTHAGDVVGKVRLKDLARESSAHITAVQKSQEEKERKIKEREKKREEAKQRYDLRRQLSREKREKGVGKETESIDPNVESIQTFNNQELKSAKHNANNTSVHFDDTGMIRHSTSDTESAQHESLDSLQGADSLSSHYPDKSNHLNNWSDEEVVNSTFDGKHDDHRTKVSDKPPDEQEGDELSDWEGSLEKESQLDSDISDEIEKELELMPSTFTGVSRGTSDAASEGTKTWQINSQQDVKSKSLSQLKQGALKLKQSTPLKKATGDIESSPLKVFDRNEGGINVFNGNSLSVQNETVGDKSLNLKSNAVKDKSTSLPSGTTSRTIADSINRYHRKPVSDSFTEWEIKSIDIPKKKTAELDFFADMVPDLNPLKAKASVSSQNVQSSIAVKNEDKSSTILSLPLNVLEVVAEDIGDGWGEDLDWGSEDF